MLSASYIQLNKMNLSYFILQQFTFIPHVVKLTNLSSGLVRKSFVHSTIIVLEVQLLVGWIGSTCILVPVPVVTDPVSAIGMSSPPSNELLTVCEGEEWGGVGLQSIGSPVKVLVVAVPLLLEVSDAAESLHITCNSPWLFLSKKINFLVGLRKNW